ncbi:site-specific DNA-methyltransferase [Luteirhabdus pelagi]|uniref:site-specific DNA-methyltransferase n=1 Tax=Luteirhabdus pelagi TaxID=2792783 RepID=UPI00193A8BC7|nr:site-specific DNA-methyltransferase [Luteirhabdus pelagi]
MDGTSLTPQEIKLQQLKELLPEAFSEGKIDWEKLQLTLGRDIDLRNERYVLNWAGKSDAFRALQTPATQTLIPLKEESINFDETENIFIEGENLEVLKVLQRSYFNKVKMIYIDPPYNTGNDSFIYPDKFSETKEDYQKRVGDKDEDGYMTKEGLYHKNSKENGQYHSNWLNMMYPRLFLAKNLLKDDGVIFVSIDDHEVHNLKLLMNEIFGEENFIECITWNKRVPKNDKGIGNIHEYIFIYAKNSNLKHEFKMPKEGLDEINELRKKLKRKGVSISEAEKQIRKLYEKKGYDRGITLYNNLDKDYRLWGKINMSWPNSNTFGPTYEVLHPLTKKPVNIPDRGWRWKKDTFEEALDVDNIEILPNGSVLCGRIWFDKDENTQPSSVLYLDVVDSLLLRSILSLKSDGGIEVEKLFDGKSYFSYPKPTSIIKMLVNSISPVEDGEIILDFFAGSATSAHSVLKSNSENNYNRKFICVQLAEKTDKNSAAAKAGYKNLSDVAKERIKLSSQNIKEENPDYKGDLGFKVLKLSDSNFKQWRQLDVKDEKALEKQLDMFVDPVSENAVIENMVYELLLKSGKDLNSKINHKDSLYIINDNEMVLMLEQATEETVKTAINLKPIKVIALDRLFKGNDQLKTNTALQMKDAGIEFKTI